MSDSVDKLTEFATTQLTNLIDATKAAMPQVTKLVLDVSWANALATVVLGSILLVLGLISLTLSFKLWKKECNTDRNGQNDFPGYGISSVAFFIAAAFLFLGTAFNLFDVWAWIGLWRPDLYLIHNLLAAHAK